MRQVYEVGDVFAYEPTKENYMIVATDRNLIYKLINLADGCGFEEGMDEDSLTEFINEEDFKYIGRGKDIIKIDTGKSEVRVFAMPYEGCQYCPYIKEQTIPYIK